MRILVAGATGVVGRRLIPQLVRAGHEVTAVVRSSAKARAVEAQGAVPLQIDLFDPFVVERTTRGTDAIINLATSIPPSSRAALPWAWRENTRVRRHVSANLAHAALANDVKTFIQESFAPIYADGGDAWLDEDAPIKPASYNRALLDAEDAVRRFTAHASAPCAGIVLRFGLFYGGDSSFTQDMIRAVRKGIAVAFGDSRGYVSSISHDDAASAVAAALGVSSGTFNVVDDEPLRRRDYYDAIASAIGAPPPRFPPRWLWRLFGSIGETLARSQRISNARFKAASGWAPRYRSAREGFAALVQSRAESDG